MSLRSGRNYCRDFANEHQAETAEKEQGKVSVEQPMLQQPSQSFDAKSQSSRFTRSSHQSSASSAATRAHAKAQAARAQLAYAEKEADVMKRKAELDASLHVLQCQKAVAAAEAEASAYEEAAIQSGELSQEHHVEADVLSRSQRTSEYVQQQCEFLSNKGSSHHLPWKKEENYIQENEQTRQVTTKAEQSSPQSEKRMKDKTAGITFLTNPNLQNTPRHTSGLANFFVPEPSGAQDFARYLIRKELVSTGLLHFDEKPENYWAWKASFISATKDLNLTAREEMDLLAKWLGPKSSEQVKRLRAVHILDPSAGLHMAWQRLEECYGSPEVIEDALFKKVEEFPRLTNKDGVKLQELSDILLELECAKQDGSLPGLAYLDTARGVKQIVEKLPFHLQEKWAAVGTQHKETYGVAFPPFSVFTKFIQHQAKIKNDPSFAVAVTNSQIPPRAEKFASYRKTTVSAHKTDIVAGSTQSEMDSVKTEEPDRQCPIHNKPHPLKKCKLFREKPLAERQAYLKEHRICYKCCGSVQHIAKDCKALVKCSECNSTRHISALHPGPAPITATTTIENNNEEQNKDSTSVVSKCTEVCGHMDTPRSCSKICLVKVYPAGKMEKVTKMYAVIDEQSNRSLAKSQFFDLFQIETQPTSYTLKTCAGKVQAAGRRALNFLIESMDGKMNIQLPPLLECDAIPDDRTEIPSPDIANHHPHLHSVADKIHPVDQSAPILLLLGRDILRLHKVREQINGPHNAPYAQRLDLGWVIIGEVCLGKDHNSSNINVYKTHTLDNGRPTHFEPCPNIIRVKENYGVVAQQDLAPAKECVSTSEVDHNLDKLGLSVFDRSKNDDEISLSIDDRRFLKIMDSKVYQNNENSWVAPLPFRASGRRLPPTRDQALKRLRSLRKTLEKKPDMKKHYMEFIQKMVDSDQGDPAPPLPEMNSRPLVAISTDPDCPEVLTPAALLTQKMNTVSAPSGSFSSGQLFGKQWKHVQHLADTFWKRWKRDYLSTLQSRSKWTQEKPNIQEGDVVLLKDIQTNRNEWPLGLIVKSLHGKDGKVRKVEVRTAKEGTLKTYLRPVSDIVVLIPYD